MAVEEIPLVIEDDEALALTLEEDDALALTLKEDGFVVEEFVIDSFTTDPTIVEVGRAISDPTFTASYNRTPGVATISDSDNATPDDITDNPTEFTRAGTFVKTTINDEVTFTLEAESVGDDTAEVTIKWQPLVFFGAAVAGPANESFIELLGSELRPSHDGTFEVDAGPTQKICYAAPQSFGTPRFFVNGFEGGFFLKGSASVENAYGVTITYDLYESDFAGLGETEVEVRSP